MHPDHAVFISGVNDRRKVTLSFVSKEDGGRTLVRSCAPMDYGPSSVARNPANRYHFWDYDSDSPTGRHTLSLLPEQVVSIVITEDSFDPAEFIKWETKWHHPRDWGEFS